MSQNAVNIFNAFDYNGNGTIEQSEFISAIACLGSVLSKDECLRVFEQMDADRDGKVTLQEYLNWYENGTQIV